MLLNNIYSFFSLYEPSLDFDKELKVNDLQNILDKWIVAKFNLLVKECTEQMDAFDLTRASRPIIDFTNELSTWYLRRSRDRFKGEDLQDKSHALATIYYILLNLSKICAPFMPFISEELYGKLGGSKESIHLEDWPEIAADLIDNKLLEQMETARKLIEQALSVRAAAGIKVRQPFSKLYIINNSLAEELFFLIKDEVNVKDLEVVDQLPQGENYKIGADENYKVCLDIA